MQPYLEISTGTGCLLGRKARFMRSFITAVYCWPFMFIYTVLYCTNAVIGSMHVSYFSEIFQE